MKQCPTCGQAIKAIKEELIEPPKTIKHLGEHLIYWRKVMGIKSKDLAAQIGCRPENITRWERENYRSASIDTIKKIVKALHKDVILSVQTPEESQC